MTDKKTQEGGICGILISLLLCFMALGFFATSKWLALLIFALPIIPIILLIGGFVLFFALVLIICAGVRVYMMFFESEKLKRLDRLTMLRELRKALKDYRSTKKYINSTSLTIDNLEYMKSLKNERDEASKKIKEIRAKL